MAEKLKQLYDAAWVEEAVAGLVERLLKQIGDFDGLAIVGIRTRGAILAQRIAAKINKRKKTRVPLGALDITLYRDDLSTTRKFPAIRATEIPFNVEGMKILLVDDVLYTGRTIRAAIDELVDFGRPKWIQLAVLIDRGCQELPIRADYAAQKVDAPPGQFVRVHFKQVDGKDEVVIVER